MHELLENLPIPWKLHMYDGRTQVYRMRHSERKHPSHLKNGTRADTNAISSTGVFDAYKKPLLFPSE